MIDLYTSPTPNGYKISVALEELNIPYNVHVVNLQAGDQKKEEFLKLNPNGRIPVIVDKENNNLPIMESGAQLIYLAEKAGKLLPSETTARSKVMQWLMFQMGGIGPMMGQANVFFRYFPEKLQPAIDRYHNECRRLFEVVNTQLSTHEWIAGDYSIADIANWCWIRTYKWSGVNIDGLEHLNKWMKKMYSQPGISKGLDVPFKVKKLLDDEGKAKEFSKNASKMVKK